MMDIMQSDATWALPDGISMDEIRILASDELWKNDPQTALVLSLRRSGKFDEDDYLARYQDVAENGICPIEHYVRHGCHEERYFALKGRKPRAEAHPAKAPDPENLEEKLEDLREENAMLLEQIQLLQEELEKLQAR